VSAEYRVLTKLRVSVRRSNSKINPGRIVKNDKAAMKVAAFFFRSRCRR